MNKSALRQQYLTQRRALSPEDVAYGSEQIANRFFDSVFTGLSVRTIHTFLPITRQNEVNTWPITRRVWSDYPLTQIAVSVTDRAFNQLTHYVLAPDTLLLENRWGIPEPDPASCTPISSQVMDIVLVPLLAFDGQGHRVGYGKGYYDRFLAECRPDCLKIGLSFFDPAERIDDVASTDVQLNRCITPQRAYHLNRF